jgi:hypothetical protein
MSDARDDFDAWEDRIERLGPQGWLEPEPSANEPPLDFARHVDLAAGEFFRNTWQRRLADAHGNCGYVARQMRKAGVPLELALAILLVASPKPSSPLTAVGSFDHLGDERTPVADERREAVARPGRHLVAAAA